MPMGCGRNTHELSQDMHSLLMGALFLGVPRNRNSFSYSPPRPNMSLWPQRRLFSSANSSASYSAHSSTPSPSMATTSQPLHSPILT
jgi:hypothetical protein